MQENVGGRGAIGAERVDVRYAILLINTNHYTVFPLQLVLDLVLDLERIERGERKENKSEVVS